MAKLIIVNLNIATDLKMFLKIMLPFAFVEIFCLDVFISDDQYRISFPIFTNEIRYFFILYKIRSPRSFISSRKSFFTQNRGLNLRLCSLLSRLVLLHIVSYFFPPALKKYNQMKIY